MNEIVSYFNTIPSSHRALLISGGIALFWLMENAFPFFQFKYNKWHHAGINIFFTLTTIVVNFVLAFILIKSSEFGLQNHFGILQWLPEMNIYLFTLIGLLLLDLIGAYLPHFVEHKIKFLWRFHLIHHTDTWIDTTSANRHHPGESVIRFLFCSKRAALTPASRPVAHLHLDHRRRQRPRARPRRPDRPQRGPVHACRVRPFHLLRQ